MPRFARHIGVDYSGAHVPTASLPGLRVFSSHGFRAGSAEVKPPPSARRHWTRRGLAHWLADEVNSGPPTLIGISVGNLVAGDRVLVARENGSGGILKDEYTPVAASAGATALTVVESIKTDTPSSGVIRIKGVRHTYSGFNAGTKTFSGLSPALPANIVTADDVFVPFIDKAAASAAESVTFIYNANFSARVDVRNGSGASPIIPFNTLISVTGAGASVNASRNSDV